MKKLPLLALLFLAACAANPTTGGRTFSLVTQNEERLIGESAAESVLKEYGLYRPESATAKYIDNLCNRTFAVTEAAADPIQCNLLDDGAFNASATPGYMLINRGLLPFLSSEAELAAVLGHESGHITARHINQSATQAKVAGLATAILVGAVAAKSNNAGTTVLAASTAGVATAVGLSAYSRAHETEADALGRRYMQKLGYDPRESVHMVRAMQMYDDYQQQQEAAFNNGKIAPTSLLDKLKSSHPATPERLAAAIAAVGEPPEQSAVSDTTGRTRYLESINGLTFGPARRYGIARKAELVLTQQRTIIPLPNGVTTAYTPSGSHDNLGTWLVGHPQSGAYLTITSIKITAGRSPATVVAELLPFMHEPITRQPIGTTGITGYTATYHFLTNEKRYRILAVGASNPVDQMLILTAVYPNEEVMQREDANLMAIVSNMRFLNEEQADKYKQLEVFTFRAAAGDSVARQASKLPVTALNEDLFRALNNLPAPQEMTVGQIYKTILDPNP